MKRTSVALFLVGTALAWATVQPSAAQHVFNQAPKAVAGPPQLLAFLPGGTSVLLNGTASSDPDGDPLTYVWSDSHGNVIGNTSAVKYTVPAPFRYRFILTVSDGRGGTGTDSVSVVVEVDTMPPQVSAPPDLVVNVTEAGGARGSASAKIAAFLVGASATDNFDHAPVFTGAQVNGTPADNNTLFPEGTTMVTFGFVDFVGNLGIGTANVIVVSHQDGDLFVGTSQPGRFDFGLTTGRIQRIRDTSGGGVPSTNVTDYCASPPSDGFDPAAFWDIPGRVAVDTKGRVIFQGNFGFQSNRGLGYSLLRCNSLGAPAENLSLLGQNNPYPFSGQAIIYVQGLHIARLREILIDPHVNNGLPKLINEDGYVFGVCLSDTPSDPLSGRRSYQTWRYHADLNFWDAGPDPGAAGPQGCNSRDNFDMISHSGATYITGGGVLRKVKMPLNVEASGTAGGANFQLNLSLFGKESELPVGTVVHDLTQPGVPSGCTGVTSPPSLIQPFNQYNSGFNGLPLGGTHDVIYDEFGFGGLVLASSFGGDPPVMINVGESLLDMPSNDDYFWNSVNGCTPSPEIKLTGFAPPGAPAQLSNGVSTPNGVMGTDVFNGIVYRITGPPNYFETIANGLNFPYGLGAWPQKASAGFTLTVIIRVDSPVDVLVTDANGKKIGVGNGQPVNDFGTDGFDSGPGEPRFFAINNPAPGAFAVQSVGTGSGPFTVHVYSADFSKQWGEEISTTGITSPGSIGKHDFTLGVGGSVSFSNQPPVANAGADQTVTATSANGAMVALDGSGSSDPDGDALGFTWSGPFGLLTGAQINPTVPAGIHSITLSVDDGRGGTASSNVTITVNAPAGTTTPVVTPPASITIFATEAGGARGNASAALSAFLASGTATDSGDPIPSRLAPQAGGLNVDSATLFALGTTGVTFRFQNASGNIGAATANVTVSLGQLVVTPANSNRLYGDSNPTFSGTIAGLQNGDNITATYSSVATQASAVGSSAITATLSDPGNKLGNYSVTLNSGVLTINPAPLSVTAENQSRFYGDPNPVFTGSIVGLKNGDGIMETFSSAATPASSVGSYAIVPALSDPMGKLGDYAVATSNGMLAVNPAALTISAYNASRFYGANNAAFTGTITGIKNTDPINAIFASGAGPASLVGSYSIVPSVVDPFSRLGNYALLLLNGTLSVVPETTSLAVTLTPPSIIVGQSTTVTVTLTAADMVIPIPPGVLAPITVTSPIVSDILANNGVCTPLPSAIPGQASCTVAVTSVEPNGRTLNASFAATSALAASSGTGNLIVTAAMLSQQSCIKSDFRNVAVAGNNSLWFSSVFKIKGVKKQKVTFTFFKSSLQFNYLDSSQHLVTVNLPVPDGKITFDPYATSAATSFDAVDNVWLTTIPWDLDDNALLTATSWLVPAGGIPGDIEPVTWCGTFASDTAGVDIGWRWSAAAYSSFSGDNTVLGVKPMNTDYDNPPASRDNAGTPENFKGFLIPGARGKGGKNYTGSYSGSAKID